MDALAWLLGALGGSWTFGRLLEAFAHLLEGLGGIWKALGGIPGGSNLEIRRENFSSFGVFQKPLNWTYVSVT